MASQTLTDQLSDSAQQQLAVLREALESRLATLEEVLADPSRGESLAGLILDLSRIATEEAQAAASQACLATRAEADKEITELRTSAKAALEAAQTALRSAHASLEQERAIGVDLRRAADQAHLEIQKQAELLEAREQLEASLKSAREQLETEVARHKTIAADLQRTAADAQQQLETERASARKAYDEVAAELAHERKALAGRERAHAKLQSELDAERASGAGVRGAIDRAETRVAMLEREQAAARAAHEAVIAELARERKGAAERATELEATLGRESSDGRAAHEELSSELARQRKAAALLQKALAEGQQALAAARADLQVERTSNADLRQAVEYADQQLASARSNETQTLANHEQLVAQLDRRHAEAATKATAGDVPRELASARTETDALRAETEGLRAKTQGLRAELDAARTRLEALTTERDTAAGELQAARKWINEQREAEAEFALQSPAAHPPPAAPPAPPAKHKATAAADDGWKGVRLANRYVFSEEIAVKINGDPGRLFDLSISGCQLLSPKTLKPNHTVKVTLPNEKKPVICTGTVVWTRLEPPAAGRALRYRAGVRFTKADELAIETFAARHGATV